MKTKALIENGGAKIFNSAMSEWVVHPEDGREYLYNINIAFDKVPEDWFVGNLDIPIAQDYSEWVNEWDSKRVDKTIEKELRTAIKELYPDLTLEWASIKHTNVTSYLIISLTPEDGDWTDGWTEEVSLTDEEADIDFEEGAGLTESKTLNENRLEIIWNINPNVVVQQIDKRDLKKAIRNRRRGGEDETGSGGLWDLAFEETLNYIFWEVGLTDLTDEEHYEYTLLAEEVYNILIANEENYIKGKRPVLDENKTLNEKEANKVIADYQKEKINKLNENSNNQEYEYRLLSRLVSDCKYFLGHGNCNEAHSLWGLNIEDHIKAMHDLYDRLIVKPEWLTKEDINDYETKLYNCKPKYGNLDENKTLNEREEDEMSLEQRVITVLDELNYLEKVGEYAYIYYYDKSDYRDNLDPETIDYLVAAAKSGDWTDAWYELTLGFDYLGYTHEYITDEVVNALEKVAPLTDEEFNEVKHLLRDFIQIDYSTYLDDEVPVYIMVDTGDGNYDFTLNPNYNFNWIEETAEDEPLELASLTWLAGTQGYTLDQVLKVFREGISSSKFLRSIVREGLENHTSMSAVTFLGTMRIMDLLSAATGTRDLKINADTYVGLFDTWSGSGSLFGIKLEQGLVIPGNIINRIGTAKGTGDNGYAPDQVYSFSGGVYDSKINLKTWIDTNVLGESKTLAEDSLTEDKALNENITEDNLTIVLNYVFNTDEDSDQYGDSFLYDIDIWKGNEQLYPITKPVYQTYKEMMNGDDYDIDYALRQALQEAYPEYIIEYAEIMGELYDMTAIINCLDEDGNYIDMEVLVKLEEIEDTAWDDKTRLGFWA